MPFQVTRAAGSYEGIAALPAVIVLDNIRSLYNVGAFFRIADATRVEKLWLCGITGRPPHRGISKTALGAEERVAWEGAAEAGQVIERMREGSCEIAAVETTVHSVDLFDWAPCFPVCLVFGNEVEGIRPEVLERCDTHIRIPMLGTKQSLNVATAGGVVVYELLRKYRGIIEAAQPRARLSDAG